MKSPLRITAITGGKNEPSARYRVRQYIDQLVNYDIKITEYVPFIEKSGRYWYHAYPIPIQVIPQLATAGLRILSRVPAIINSYESDITLIQREFLTAFQTTENLTKRPRIFDIDDAIWLRLKFTSGFARRIVNRMDGLICGNGWLADYFSDCNVPTWVVPTAVDTDKWKPALPTPKKTFIIGWIGTSGNFQYLYKIEKALSTFFSKHPSAKLLIVSDQEPFFSLINKNNVDFIRWSKEIEVQAVQRMDIGLMPLDNNEWEKGKCSYKMLLYMATGIPVVVSPIGMNCEILGIDNVGFGPTRYSEWVDVLTDLYDKETLRSQMGQAGRRVIENYYSLNVLTPQLSTIFHNFFST